MDITSYDTAYYYRRRQGGIPLPRPYSRLPDPVYGHACEENRSCFLFCLGRIVEHPPAIFSEGSRLDSNDQRICRVDPRTGIAPVCCAIALSMSGSGSGSGSESTTLAMTPRTVLRLAYTLSRNRFLYHLVTSSLKSRMKATIQQTSEIIPELRVKLSSDRLLNGRPRYRGL
jgi:hypothetical protein